MIALIIVLLVAAAIAAVWREFVWMDKLKEVRWKHNDRMKTMSVDNEILSGRVKDLESENEVLEASAREALTALREAHLVVTDARVGLELVA